MYEYPIPYVFFSIEISCLEEIQRRRTQIRLAQRAYRSRKDNAIQVLEKKVQDLQETNEEISNAFMRFHDYLLVRGILDVAPDLAHHLHCTTENILSLARTLDDEDDDNNVNGDNQHFSPSQEQFHEWSSSPAETIERTVVLHPGNPKNQQPIVLGYNFTHGFDMLATSPTLNNHTLTTSITPPMQTTMFFQGNYHNMSVFEDVGTPTT